MSYSKFISALGLCLAFGCSAAVPGDAIDEEGIGSGEQGIRGGGSSGQFCGGFAGIACPGSGRCVDDPSDSCDPRRGGADCGGICQCIQNVACIRGSHFDSSPDVCSCVPDVNPCAAVTCLAGTECVVAPDGSAQCVAPVDPCASATCLAGTRCVAVDGEAQCVRPRRRRGGR